MSKVFCIENIAYFSQHSLEAHVCSFPNFCLFIRTFFNFSDNRLLTATDSVQLWAPPGGDILEEEEEIDNKIPPVLNDWNCIWQCKLVSNSVVVFVNFFKCCLKYVTLHNHLYFLMTPLYLEA